MLSNLYWYQFYIYLYIKKKFISKILIWPYIFYLAFKNTISFNI